MNFEALLASFGQQLIANALANPQGFLDALNGLGCHTASDLAIDAIDAYQHGHISREQCLRIIGIALAESPKPCQPTASQDIAELLLVAKHNHKSPDLLQSIRDQLLIHGF